MGYLERIHACNNFCAGHYPAFLIEGKQYGHVQPAFAQRLAEWPDVFTASPGAVCLNAGLRGYAERTKAVAPVMRVLHEQGVIDTWVNEAYPITHSFGGHAEMEIERAATLYLGAKSFGIHVNGLVRKNDGVHVWVGTRSHSKPFWPGKKDQIVAGGQPVGISLLENVIKESAEEANIPRELAQKATPASTLTYRQESMRGLDHSTIFSFDLWLPEDFAPQNTDGEVEGFELVPLAEIAYLTEYTEEFKDNCNLVNIDLLLRLGVITPQHTDYALIRDTLYG